MATFSASSDYSEAFDTSPPQPLKAADAIVNNVQPEEKEKAKKEEPILLFDDVKPGMHVRMRCKCEAFIIKMNSGAYIEDRWLSVIYTKIQCQPGPKNLEILYAERVPIETFKNADIYHGDVFSSVFPVTEVPAPSWYPSLEKGPASSSKKRMIQVRIFDPSKSKAVNFIIPGELSDQNAYITATLLRDALDSSFSQVEILPRSKENVEEYLKVHIKGQPLPAERVNEIILYDELVAASIESPNEASVYVDSVVPLPRESCIRVLEEVRKFPLWGQKSVRLTLEDGVVVSMSGDGKIS